MDPNRAKTSTRPQFTNIDRSKCHRIVPMEVLVLGLPKTGTSSVRQALFDLGYSDVYHMSSVLLENPRDSKMWVRAFDALYGGKGTWGKAEWDQLLGHCMAVTDSPCVDFTYELIEAYPDAKVILLTRDIDSWYESYKNTVGTTGVAFNRRHRKLWSIQRYLLPRYHFSDICDMFHKYCGEEWFPARGKRKYLDQIARVRQLVPKEKLLEFDVREGWEPFCRFLEKPVPKDKPFPKVMEREEYKILEKEVRKYEIVLMAIQASKILGGCALAIVASWFIWSRFRI